MAIVVTTSHRNTTTEGWVSQTAGRGTWDILWSSAFTIFLCCWTSVCTNVPAITDSYWDRFRDKLNLACLGMVGPDFVFALALGQWDSARRSVKRFKTKYPGWTLTHAFFANMGGFVLESPEFPRFPLDAEQLYYLVSKGYLPYPDVDIEIIKDKNKSDRLARFVTVCQVLWFGTNCIGRVTQHLGLTTIELTTLGFVFLMFATSYCWRHKPSDVGRPIILEISKSIAEIRIEAGIAAHISYNRTPLDFIGRNEWFLSLVWAYYTRILEIWHIPLFSRPIKNRPINRINSVNFPETDFTTGTVGTILISAYSAIFMAGWNFSFPTRTECLLWRIASIIALSYGIIGSAWAGYCHSFMLPNWKNKSSRSRKERVPDFLGKRVKSALVRWRNNSADQDRELEVPLSLLVPTTMLCVTYCVSRAYILTEDVIGLRRLPSRAFETVDWSRYVPHF